MPRRNISRINPRRHRLDALPVPGEKQSLKVHTQGLVSVSVPDRDRQPLKVRRDVLLQISTLLAMKPFHGRQTLRQLL